MLSQQLQINLELKLKDFESRKLQQSVSILQKRLEKMEKTKEKFNDIKQQLTIAISAIIQNVHLELESLKQELTHQLMEASKNLKQIIIPQITQQLVQPELETEIRYLRQRVDSLQQQVNDSEKNEIYLMMLNSKYIKENEELATHLWEMRQRRFSSTENNFYPHHSQSGFRSKFLNKYT